MNCAFIIKKNRLFTVLRKNGFSKYYGFIETDLKNTPTIKQHYIQPFYQKSGHGKYLLNYTEKILFKEYNKINLDMWCIDKCYEKNLNYYLNNEYIKHHYFDKNNTVSKIDNHNNIYYQILLQKNKNIVPV